MNVQDVANRVRRTFGDDGGVQVTDEDIFRWINDAQLQISVDNEELLETVSQADIVAGQADYTLPSNCNTLRSLMHNNFRLRGMTLNQFNEYMDGFKAPASEGGFGGGRPEVFMVYANVITLFPTPDKSIANGLRLFYARHPDSVGNFADALTVPDRYHNSIVEYCLKMAYEMDENFDAASYKRGEFTSQVQKLKGQEKVTSTEYYPSITVLPQDANFYDPGGY